MSLSVETMPVDLAGLVSDLRSPDPAVRDEGAFSALAQRIGAGRDDVHLAALGDAGTALLADPQVQARSFGALLVAAVVDRVNALGGSGGVRTLDLVRWLAAFVEWYPHETDLRGHDDTLGWLHAVAHGADTLGTFGGSPLLGAAELTMLLDLATERLHAPTDAHLVQKEDDRLGLAVMTVLLRGAVPTASVLAWIDRLAAVWRPETTGEGSGATPANVDNTLRFARTLHLQLTVGVRTEPAGPVRAPADRDQVLAHLERALADADWFYGEAA